MKKRQLDFPRLLAILTLIGAIIYFNLYIFAPKALPGFLRVGLPRKAFNLLILGTDTSFNAETGKPMPELDSRTDTIILAHVNPFAFRINLLAIPRDTYAEIPGYGWQKINAANVYGGLPLVEDTITKLTNKKIDYVIMLKPRVVTDLVNLLGGVVIDVEKDMFYTDRAQGLKINLKAGRQKLDGKKAHEYIRFRHDLFGDIGRIERQQKFLQALGLALLKPSNIIKAPYTIQTAFNGLETNLSLAYSIRLANLARLSEISTATVSGEAKLIPYAGSVWVINQEDLQAKLRQYF